VTDREEFERRLLALVRDFLDESDEDHPEGYDIEDFIVLYHVRYAPPDGADLNPWDTGSRPGWWLGVAFSSTTGAYSHDEAILAEALQRVRDLRYEMAREGDASDEGASEEA
jgi:hypothetical protein